MVLCLFFLRTKLTLTRWSSDWKGATVLYEQAGRCAYLAVIGTAGEELDSEVGMSMISFTLVFLQLMALDFPKTMRRQKKHLRKLPKDKRCSLRILLINLQQDLMTSNDCCF